MQHSRVPARPDPAGAEESPCTATLLRQPVLDARGEVQAYELLARTPYGGATRDALRYRDALQLADRRLLFVQADAALLASPVLEQTHSANLVLQVAACPGDDEAGIAELEPVLRALHDRGFQLALDQGCLKRPYAFWLALATYVKADARQLTEAQIASVLKFLRDRGEARLVATGVDTQERFARLRELGVPLFQGDWFATPAPVPAGSIQPSQAVVIQLVNLLRQEAELSEIEPLLKSDPSLSFDLLRVINSSGMGLSCEITSLRHAVMILGQRRLFRWATLLMTRSRAAGTPPALAAAALVRGRLMELLAAQLLPPQDCDNAFVTGVFSLLDVLLDLPMAQALAPLALPQPVADALLRRSGMLAPFLDLTEACEHGDGDAFASAAGQLQLSSHDINWAHLQALAWAEELAAAW